MNTEESKQFVRELISSFPGFEDAARNSPDIGATHRAWIRSWSDLELSECVAVLHEMERSAVIGFDDWKTPGPYIRRLVLANRNRNKTSEAERSESALNRQTRNYQGSPMAQALDAALKAKAEGKREQECLAIIDKAIPASAEYDQPTSKCKEHCHQGTLVVWRADFVQKVIEGKLAIGKLTRAHTYVIACYCGEGFDKNHPKRSKLPVYSTSQFCRYKDDGNDSQRLQAWIDEKRQGKEWAA